MFKVSILDKDINFLGTISTHVAHSYENDSDMIIKAIETEGINLHEFELEIFGRDTRNIIREENKILFDNKLFTMKSVKATKDGSKTIYQIKAVNIMEELDGDPIEYMELVDDNITSAMDQLLTGTNFTLGTVDLLIAGTITTVLRPDIETGEDAVEGEETECASVGNALRILAEYFGCEFICRNQEISVYKEYVRYHNVVVKFGSGVREIYREANTTPTWTACKAIMRKPDGTQMVSELVTLPDMLTTFRKHRSHRLNVSYDEKLTVEDLDIAAQEFLDENGIIPLDATFKISSMTIDPSLAAVALEFGDIIVTSDELIGDTTARIVESKRDYMNPAASELSISVISNSFSKAVSKQMNDIKGKLSKLGAGGIPYFINISATGTSFPRS